MVKDHSDSKRGNPLLPHGQQGFFYMHHPTDRIAYTTAFVTPVMEHWLEREIAQWVHPMKDRSDDLLHYDQTLLPQSYLYLYTHTHIKFMIIFGCCCWICFKVCFQIILFSLSHVFK